jgi:uncharacterized protein (TIGR03546 family)
MIFTRLIFKFIRMIHRETSPTQISLAVTVGFLLALTPALTLQWWILGVLLILVRMNVAVLTVSFLITFPFAKLLVPVADWIGINLLLNISSLKGIWTALYHLPVVPYTYFYNSVVMGNLFLGVTLGVPLFTVCHYLVTKNGSAWGRKIQDSLTWKRYTMSRIYRRNVR